MRSYQNDNYGFDHIRWRRQINSLAFTKETYVDSLNLLLYEIFSKSDAAFAYFFARDFCIKQEEMCQIAIDNLDYKYLYFFAKNIPNIEISNLEDLILSSKNIAIISKFVSFVPKANLNKFKDFIIDKKNLKSYYMFIRHCPDFEISEFKEVLLASNKPKYVYELAKKLSDEQDLLKAESIVLNSNSFTYLKLYAQNIPSANISAFDKKIMKRNNKQEILKFSKSVKNSKLKNIINFI